MLREVVVLTASLVTLGLPLSAPQRATAISGQQRESAQPTDHRLDRLKLQIRTVGGDYPYEEKARYGAREEISIRVFVDNSGSERVVLPYVGSFVHYLPRLVRDGAVQPYSEQMQKRINDPRKPSRESGDFVRLPPSTLSEAAILHLADWYGKLEPGVYDLTLKYRLYKDGPEVESGPVMFEVLR
jgi:hypothetical protein